MLPKISYPLYDLVVPTTKQKIKVRPMLVKEEKILLMAKQAATYQDELNAMQQVVNNCIVTENFNINELTLVDLEYLFLRIRGMSISNVTTVAYRDKEDDKRYEFEINFDNIEVKFDETVTNFIKIDDMIALEMKYPKLKFYLENEFIDFDDDKIFDKVLLESVSKVFDGDQVYHSKNFADNELKDFVESLPATKFFEIKTFFDKMPRLHYDLEYKNSFGNDRKITLKTFDDFFTFR